MDNAVAVGLTLATTWLLAAGSITAALSRTAGRAQPFRLDGAPDLAPPSPATGVLVVVPERPFGRSAAPI